MGIHHVDAVHQIPPQVIRLARRQPLEGRVLDFRGNPVAGAFVWHSRTIYAGLIDWQTRTDSNGQFVWYDAPITGGFRFEVFKPTYLPSFEWEEVDGFVERLKRLERVALANLDAVEEARLAEVLASGFTLPGSISVVTTREARMSWAAAARWMVEMPKEVPNSTIRRLPCARERIEEPAAGSVNRHEHLGQQTIRASLVERLPVGG